MSELVGPIPGTGELVDRGDLPAVSRSLGDLRELQDHVKEAIRALTDILVEESTKSGQSTFHFEGIDVRLSSATETIHDLERMREELADAGLPDHRLDELIVPTVTYKLDGNVARQLAGANPNYAEIIAACTTKVPKTRYANIQRT